MHLVVLGMCMGSGSVHAQRESAPSSDADAAGNEASTALTATQLDQITVTATRTSEVITEVPLSISAFDRSAMDRIGISNFSDIARITPGVTFNTSDNTIAVRGISSTAGAATTGVYIDETPIQIRKFGTQPKANLPVVFDLDRIEVLRGPQGTLYGAGSQGGTVRFITPQPSLDYYELYAKGDVSFTESGEPTYEAGAAIGGPIVENVLGFRVSAHNRRDGGWVDRVDYSTGSIVDENANWSDTSVLRAALTWTPIDGLFVTPSVNYQDGFTNDTSEMTEAWSDFDRREFYNSNAIRLTNSDRFILPGLKVEYLGGAMDFVSNTSYFKRDQTTFYDAGAWRLGNLQLSYGFDLLGEYGQIDENGVAGFRSPGRIINNQENFTHEMRLQSNTADSPFSWVAGAYYGRSRQRNVERGESEDYDRLYQALFGMTVEEFTGYPMFEGIYSFITDTVVRDEQLALFGDLTWRATDRLSMSAGIRWADMEFDFIAGRASMTQEDWTYNDGTASESPVSPRFNVSYRANDAVLVYSNVSKGFRSGGANSSSIADRCAEYIDELGIGDTSAYDADEVWSYDLGVKGEAFNRRLIYDASIYRVDWDGIQQSNSIVGCGLSYIGNFGKARSQGVDLTVQAALTDSFVADFAFGYNKSEYLDQVFASASPGASVIINEGNSLPDVVPRRFTVGGTYHFDAFGQDAYVRGSYEYSGRRNGTLPSQDPGTSQYNPVVPRIEATKFARLRAGLDLYNVDVSVYVDNLLDSSPLLSRSSTSRSAYYRTSTWRPRTYGMTLIYYY